MKIVEDKFDMKEKYVSNFDNDIYRKFTIEEDKDESRLRNIN